MKKIDTTWFGVLKGTALVFTFLFSVGILGAIYGIYINFDKIEGTEQIVEAIVAGVKNALPILGILTMIYFFIFVSFKAYEHIFDSAASLSKKFSYILIELISGGSGFQVLLIMYNMPK